MTRTKLFRSNRTQAVRLPKDVAFPDSVEEVVVLREGVGRRIMPATTLWDEFFDQPGIDIDRGDQPEAQDREAF